MTQKLSNKIENLFCDETKFDMKFFIENENIEYPAHKLIIGLGSDVLYNMVYGNDTTLPASTITVPGYSSKDFLPVLKYLYTTTTGTFIWDLDEDYTLALAVAKYFGLIEFGDVYNAYVAETVDYDNALDIYARFHHRNDIVARTSMKIIQLQLFDYLNSDNDLMTFFALPMEALTQILRMDELGINSDEELFEKMMMEAW